MMSIFRLFIISTLLTATGCGSFLASVDAPPIEDDPGERTYGARVEDEAAQDFGAAARIQRSRQTTRCFTTSWTTAQRSVAR